MNITRIALFVGFCLLVIAITGQPADASQWESGVASSNPDLQSNAYYAGVAPQFASPYVSQDISVVHGQQNAGRQPIRLASHTAKPSPFQEASYTSTSSGVSCCSDCGCADCCCPSLCSMPGCRFFADFLWLRPRNVEVVYAVPFDGPVVGDAVPIQIGEIGVVDSEYEPAFRVGFACAISPCSALEGTYTHFDSSSSHRISPDPAVVDVRSMVVHPSSLNAAADWLSAEATHDINFKLADIDYRRVLSCGDRHVVSGVFGIRYAHLQQKFRSTFTLIGTEQVDTDINFDGGGIRLGLEAERHAQCTGFLVYGKAMANFVAGEFHARYFQGSTADPEIVDATWKAGRIVTMLDMELGAGWATPCGRFRITAGYLVSAWYNTIKTGDFIDAVQRNDFAGLGNADFGGFGNPITFDGVVVRSELRF